VHVESTTALGRLRRLEFSPTRFLQLTLISLGALWLIVLTGAAVRVTDSGLGCRHWPGCEAGHPLPAKDYHAFIEFGNRALGGVVIFSVLLTAVAARFVPGLSRRGRRLALWVFAGTLAQAPLGYLAVNSDLHWPVLEALRLRSGSAEDVLPREVPLAGLALVAACAVLLVTGTLATAGGPHSGGGTADRIDRLWRLAPLVYIHATAVGIFGLGLVFLLGYLASQRARWPRVFHLGLGLLGLLLVQMALGELQYRTHLPWPLVLVHVGVAAAVWALLIGFVAVLWRLPAAFAQART
jgi:cytochrome c oxidase assembly protein subunit 15